jgi:hypothetical protein
LHLFVRANVFTQSAVAFFFECSGSARDPLQIHFDACRRNAFLAASAALLLSPGEVKRDYSHVSDAADAHVKTVKALENGVEPGPYNRGSGRSYSMREVISSAERVAGLKVPGSMQRKRAKILAGSTNSSDRRDDPDSLDLASPGCGLERCRSRGKEFSGSPAGVIRPAKGRVSMAFSKRLLQDGRIACHTMTWVAFALAAVPAAVMLALFVAILDRQDVQDLRHHR